MVDNHFMIVDDMQAQRKLLLCQYLFRTRNRSKINDFSKTENKHFWDLSHIHY